MIKIDKTQEDFLSEIHDANINYLMLAQQMVKTDKVMAIYRLGISEDIADLIAGLSNSQLIKLASNNLMLSRFRFDDKDILSVLTKHNKSAAQTLAHSAILMSQQSVEVIA